MNVFDKIIQIPFPENQYRKKVTKKSQVTIHHSVSGNADGSLYAMGNYWKKDTKRVATPIGIAKSGLIGQYFSTKYYGGHIGFDTGTKVYEYFKVPKKYLSRLAVGVELLNWGGLKKVGMEYYACYGNKVNCDVVHYPEGYRGFKDFEKYSDEQIESLRLLLLLWHDTHGIPLIYNDDIWDVNKRAITGVPGIYPHTAYRFEKSDCHPQKELIEMLKSLDAYKKAE